MGAIFAVLVVGGIRNDPLRALVAFGALAFAIALSLGTHLVAIAATAGLHASGDELDRHADLAVVASGRGVDERLLAPLRSIRGVTDARAVIDGNATLVTSSMEAGAPQIVRVTGIDLLQPIPGTSGTGLVFAGPYAPNGATLDTASALNGGAIVSDRIARERRLRVGSTLDILADGRNRALRIAAILPRTVTGVDSATIFVDLSTAQTLFASAGYLGRIDCSIGADIERVRASIATILPPGTRVERSHAAASGLARLLLGMQQNLDWLAVFTIVLAALFTYNAVGASVAQRKGDIATLRGLGARRDAIFRAFLAEGMLYGSLGSFCGAMLAIAGVRAVIEHFAPHAPRITQLAFTESELVSIALALLLGTAIATLSAALPAAAAMRVMPASALGNLGPSPGLTPRRYRAFASRVVATVRRVRGTRAPAAFLAAHELLATPRRTTLVLVALALAIANTIGYAVVSSSFARATQEWAQATMRGDVVVTALGSDAGAPVALPSPALARVRDVNGVETAQPSRSFIVDAPGRGRFEIRGDDASAPQAQPSAAPLARETPAFLTAALARRLHVARGDLLTIATPSGAFALRVSGLPVEYAHPDGIAIVRFARTAAWFRDDRPDTIVARARAGTAAGSIRTRIARALAAFTLDVRTTRELREETLGLLGRSFAIARLLGGIALAIAVAGVSALLATLVLERRSQFGMLRYVGASRGFVGTMVVYEAALLAALACIVGTFVGLVAAYGALACAGTSTFGTGVTLEVPFVTLAVTLSLTFAASVLAALPAARSAGRIGADARVAG